MVRRIFAVGFLIAWAGTAWISYETPYLHFCTDLVARVGNKPLVTSCEPLSLTDAPMLALAVAGVLLLLPDVSAIEIPGIVKLERRVEEQGRRQDEIRHMIEKLEIRQSQIQQTNVFTAEKAAENVARITEAAHGLARKMQEFTQEDERSDVPNAP